MVSAMLPVKIIVVADDDAQAMREGVPPGIVLTLAPNSVLMSNDSLRMYIRQTHYDAMKDSLELAARTKAK